MTNEKAARRSNAGRLSFRVSSLIRFALIIYLHGRVEHFCDALEAFLEVSLSRFIHSRLLGAQGRGDSAGDLAQVGPGQAASVGWGRTTTVAEQDGEAAAASVSENQGRQFLYVLALQVAANRR